MDRAHWCKADAEPDLIASQILRCLPPSKMPPSPIQSLCERGKHHLYYEAPRTELLQYIPAEAKKILDVGCATGVFGEILKKQRPKCMVFGIELNPNAAATAQNRLDQVIIGDIEELDLPASFSNFDCVVCADVLEHLRNPAAALRKLAARLAPNGRIVISVPNAQFYEVPAMLSSGNWTYAWAGIMDETHRQFFTKRNLEDLFQQAELDWLVIEPLSSANENLFPLPEDRTVRLGRVTLTDLSDAEYQCLRTYQYAAVVTLKKAQGQFEQAQAAYDAGKWQEAYRLAEQAEDASPGDRLLLMGRAMAKMGQYPQAERHLREAIQVGVQQAAGELGILLTGLSRLEEALPLLRESLARNPKDDRVHAAATILHLNRREREEAWFHMVQALSLSYAHTFLTGAFTELALETGRTAEAVEVLRRLADYYPANFDLACDLAVVLIQENRLEEAQERLETVVMLSPDHERACTLLAKLRENTG
ncbi:MAG TPA: methyltransferase domain-containing protein, partial [Candidatus Hydrogenedentes bacterium]|nr:methyltransferase domain-containing protein [Candidatus Hydrogenedentota bacterium]